MSITEQIQPEIVTDPVETAKAAGLRYVTDRSPGICRKRNGDGFTYIDTDGTEVTDEKTLERIDLLRIPPAWEHVWICRNARGHIQATGRDSRGRKQYIYHPRWREVRDENKFDRMLAFGRALPAIRERVNKDLGRQGLPREKVLATVVRLLDTTFMRVGNEEYARTNDSYGLTTLRDHHVDVNGSCMHFEFRGKRGIFHEIDTCDRRLSKIVKRCQDLPGQELFKYVDPDGTARAIESLDVNDYLREITGEEFTAKDFRTWAGTSLAVLAFQELDVKGQAKTKKNITAAVKEVAHKLGNTPAICRKSYIHPAVLTAYSDGTLAGLIEHDEEIEALSDAEQRQQVEHCVLRLLEARLESAGEAVKAARSSSSS